MLRLRRIYIRNWQKIAEASLEFPEHGVVVVLGSNLAGRGKLESVGSGKTSLGEAISCTLLGINGKFSNMGHHSRDDNGDTYVKVEADLDGQPLRVELGFKCAELSKTGEGLRFSLGDGAPIERAHVRDTRQELIQTIGVTPEVSDWTIFLDGERLKFNKLSQTDALDLLMHAMDQPPWQIYQERAKRRLDALRDQHSKISGSVETLRLTLADAAANHTAAVDTANQAKTLFEQRTADYETKLSAHQTKVNAHTIKLAELRASQVELERKIQLETGRDFPEITQALGEHAATITQLETYEAGWTAHWRDCEGSRAETEAVLNRMLDVPEACPTCQRAWSRRPSQDEIATTKTNFEAQTKQTLEAKHQRDLCREDLQTTRTAVKQLNAKLAAGQQVALRPMHAAMDQLDADAERQNQALLQLARVTPQKPVNDCPAFETAATTAETRMTRAKESLVAATTELASIERERTAAQYWVTAFGPAGLPNTVLRAVIPPLNEAAKTVSDTMTGGTISVSFKASTELANGQPKPQLTTKVINASGATRLAGNSKGESGLVNLIIAETQTMIGRITSKVGYRWFDEAVNSEDPTVRRNIYQYLRRQAADRKILIFVVDHHPEAANFADHLLMAEKSAEGVTTFAWH